MPQQFASDNNAGMCPQALDALIRANAEGHVTGYGDDPWTEKACARIRELFETDCEVFFVFNGTAANALALAQICRSYHAVIAHAFSHIEEDEAGAPALFSGGAKIVTADTPLAKLTPEAVDALARKGRGVHHVKPRALSITQATELGTVYSVDEVAALVEVARAPRPEGAHGRRALCQCGGLPRLRAGRSLLARRRRCAVLRRGQERARRRRGRAVLRSRPGARVRVAGQAGGPPQLQDAARHGAVAGAARERRVARERAPRQRHGAAPLRAHRRPRRACARSRRCSRTACSWSCRRPCRKGCGSGAGASTLSWARPAAASCAPGIPRPTRSTASRPIWSTSPR